MSGKKLFLSLINFMKYSNLGIYVTWHLLRIVVDFDFERFKGGVNAGDSWSSEGWEFEWPSWTDWNCTKPCLLQALTSWTTLTHTINHHHTSNFWMDIFFKKKVNFYDIFVMILYRFYIVDIYYCQNTRRHHWKLY